ncbi:hypothetical protein ASPCAL09592 [Aspergillus calidoustus]|uniref:polynucleotide adenylyltransferase n=1 Tax=Aspergillus calidoustus TaxID=454130 RepID=A0A0U5GVX7_ASPCI|nr:hypothetical protein ASPCAL09592 [Aspergillus calidoustus]
MALPSLTSHETALCIIPPPHLVGDIERLRALYDKAHGRWPPHINLIYPFVDVENLTEATEIVQSVLSRRKQDTRIRVRLDKADCFAHKRHSTIYRAESGSGNSGSGFQQLVELRKDIFDAFEHTPSQESTLHLTIGQSEPDDEASKHFLLGKAGRLPVVEWDVSELVVLVRERAPGGDVSSSRMDVWGRIGMAGECAITRGVSVGVDEAAVTATSPPIPASKAEKKATFQFSDTDGKWIGITEPATESKPIDSPLTIASYNVLIDTPYPPPTERYPTLRDNLLSANANSDILILQEVSDEFLSFLLADPQIRTLYPFTTHGPPNQDDISPLASLRNIVALSKYRFTWDWLPFEKRHKGAVALQFDTGPESKPLVVAGVHLTCGLSDGSILAKQSQLQNVLQHLGTKHADSDWILAGDFNITTSSYTIDAAVKRQTISTQAASVLSSLDGMLSAAGLSDTYFAGRAGGSGGDLGTLEVGTLYEGEEGATFDPSRNELAARIAGQSFHSRPQRYDRIMVRGEGIDVASFNMFGVPDEGEGEAALGSDHWGIRAVLDLNSPKQPHTDTPLSKKSIAIAPAPESLSSEHLMNCLREAGAFPAPDEITHRHETIAHLRAFVNERDPNLSSDTRLTLSFPVVPVGSYGLGVWTSSSDIDLLAIGTVSPRTFFALMISKIRRAAQSPETESEIRLLRKVSAASGTMLELQVRGIRIDLQYCPATRVAETWPAALSLPPADPTFDIPMHSLLKLNPLRDMHYLQRTIPDLATFRLAYRFIKTWALRRGVYSSKLGYLGGIHITLLLSRVCKLAFSTGRMASAPDLIATFFKTYAQLDWAREMVFDPGFYAAPPRYFRSAREPAVILTQHTPKVNVARSATVPSIRILEAEFKRMDGLLSTVGGQGGDLAWSDLLGSAEAGVEDFLAGYPSYIKVNVQHWGAGGAKGRMLVGWLEWRCVSLLVDIHRKFPDIHARIWPARFTDTERQDGETGESDTEYQGCYLIGLAKNSSLIGTTAASVDRQSAEIALVAVLNTFAEQIRSDEKYFDASSSWVDVTLASRSAVRGLHVDSSILVVEDLYDDDEDDEDLTLDVHESDPEYEGATNHRLPIRARAQTSSPGPRLRPASDVLSRLRWDANIDIDDYIVGYDDRFLGEREMPVAQWKAELTDEAFIPGHRILYFRRKSDGVKVWDRERRVDLVFGSGVSGNVS